MSRVQPSKNLERLTLLYVEDEDDIRDAFSSILSRFMKRVIVAKDGQEGLELFQKESVDLIVSDIRMPRMSGLEMVSKIREQNSEIPILFTTAFGDSEYLQDAIENGVDGYLIKPIDRNQLIAKLNKIADNLVAKYELQSYMELIKVIFEEQNSLIVLLDKKFRILLSNNAFNNVFCKDVDKKFTLKDIINRMKLDDEISSFSEAISKLIDEESLILSKQNVFYKVKLKKANDEYWLLFLDDVSELKKEAMAFKEQSMIDQLTSLYNRKKLDAIEKSLFNNSVGVIIFDIDNFKKINDTHGHNIGDEVLKELSSTLKQQIRENDILMRWGGEEFVVIVRGVNSIDIVYNLAEKLRVIIENLYVKEVEHFTCSFGVSQGLVKNSEDIKDLITNADKALYVSKNSGKNRVTNYK